MESGSIEVEALAEPAESSAIAADAAIEVRGLVKTFDIPDQRFSSLKERLLHPFTRAQHRHLHALRDISFEVRRGEFIGIVGRNGSGKSTLLKILAGIYKADRGQILVSGRVAPLIELGVGFHPEFTARENVVLNAVMMGLSPREARRRFDSVIEFAELEGFVDLKLKNYSSGMMVRLAFAVMIEVDAEILLVDEVLAVGDASFQQKCADVFHRMRDSEKTVVLVTHDMTAVERYCHRAILIDDGRIAEDGEPGEVGRSYLNLNFEEGIALAPPPPEGAPAVEGQARVVDGWLEDEAGARTANVGFGEPIRIRAVVEAQRELHAPQLGLHFSNADGVEVFGFNEPFSPGDEEPRVAAGERVRIAATIENRLVPGRYFVSLWVAREGERGPVLQTLRLFDFVVYGTERPPGIVTVSKDVDVRREPQAAE